MLKIHFSNRYELLNDLLVGQLAQARGNVFAPDQIIVPSAAVRRSLTLSLAEQRGICANVQFDYLAQWLWQQMARLLPDVADKSPLAPPVLAWRVDSAFSDPAFVALHPRLAAWLDQADAVMRFELAGSVAALLDQYVTYRPEWLADWGQKLAAKLGSQAETALADEGWQAALWRRISNELQLDALQQSRRFIAKLEQLDPPGALAAGLPASAHIFCLPAMPPLHIELLQQLGRVVDLQIYVINPCREYWFEVIDRRRLSHLAARGQDQNHEEGSRLLASWGKQTQSHVDLLVDQCGEAAEDDSGFAENPADSLLASLQNAILNLTDLQAGSVQLDTQDRSFEVHCCHSLTRELEVLQDHLLGLFAQVADAGRKLAPAQILVVMPDLEAAAPLIEAIFGTAPKDRYIPYTITGRARSSANSHAQALLAILDLAGSRFAASALFGLLQKACVARRFQFDDDSLQQLRDWITASGMRWALDAKHRASFGVPADPAHTLADGLDRLFLGYALPDQVDEPFAQLLPAGQAEGSAALPLGSFWRFVDRLQQLHQKLAQPQLPAAWAELLLETLASFTEATREELDDLRELQQTIHELTEQMQGGGVTQALPLALVHKALAQLLDDPARGGVPSGNVTFSSMSSLRNLPFEVICAIGLNDGSFPSSLRPAEFDLMALQARRGDRQRRNDERNLFLDLLLAARRSLYLSYCGRSVRDNSLQPASVLVSELLETLLPAIADGTPGSLDLARQRLLVEHPLQPFAIDCFSDGKEPRLRSYNRELGEALRRSLQSPAVEITPLLDAVDDGDESDDDDRVPEHLPRFFNQPLPAPGPEWRQVSLEQLIEFFRNPCRYLLRRRLGIQLQREEDELLDEEPFLADKPATNALARRLLPLLLQGVSADAVRQLALAGNELPSGAIGARKLELELTALTAFAEQVRAATAEECLPPHQIAIEFDLSGEPWQLQASFADLRPAGLLRSRYDKQRGVDLLGAWLNHLALCAMPPPDARPCSHWLSIDGTLSFKPAEQPLELLAALLGIYRQGLSEPVHFFPKSAWAYLEKNGLVSAAQKTWRVDKRTPFAEGADAGYRLALRGIDEPLDQEFFRLTELVYGPLMEHIDTAGAH